MSVRFHSCRLVYLQATSRPVRQLVAGKVGREAIQVRLGATEEPARVAHAEAAVTESKQRAVAVGGELVAHHTVLDDRLLPLVFEHIRRVPDEYAAGHPLA